MSYAIIDYNDSKWPWKIKEIYSADSISIFLPHFKENKSIRFSKKVVKILNTNNVKDVILNNELLKDKLFYENLINNRIHIILGNNMYRVLIPRILKDISFQMKYELHKFKVALLIEDYSVDNIDLIKTIAKKVKSLMVITTDKDKFNVLTKELLKKYGIVLKVVEKNNTDLTNVNFIINVDFPSYDMNQLIISNNSVILCGFADKYEINNNFDGILIKKIDIIDPKNNDKNIDDLALCEAKIYSFLRKIGQNDRFFEREGFKLNGYFGEKGRITAEEFVKIGEKIV